MAINIITYSGKTRTAKHDAIVYDAALDKSGIFNGCDVSASGNVVTISSGYGIIKGRVFEVVEESFPVNLPGSGTTYGAVIVTLDLSATTPLTMETISSSTQAFNLTRNENVNFINGRYQMLLATYTMIPSGITNVVKASHVMPGDTLGSTNLNDYVESGVYYLPDDFTYTNIPTDVANGWLVVYDNRRQNGDTGAVKQVLFRYGSSPTHHEEYIRTRNDGVWQPWNRVVTVRDLMNGIDVNPYFGSTTRDGGIISINSKYRRIGLHVSAGKNAGIWDIGNNNWLIVSGDDGVVSIPHKLKVGEFNPTRAVTVGDDTSTTPMDFTVLNKYRKASFTASANEVVGIYDNGNGEWLLEFRKDKSNVIHNRTYFTDPLSAPKSIVRGTTTITPTKVGTPAYRDISWPEMGGVPIVVATPSTSVPQHVHVGISDVTNKGCRIHLTRTDTAGLTGISYIAIYTR